MCSQSMISFSTILELKDYKMQKKHLNGIIYANGQVTTKQVHKSQQKKKTNAVSKLLVVKQAQYINDYARATKSRLQACVDCDTIQTKHTRPIPRTHQEF